MSFPLPEEVAAGEFGTGLFYERYAAFSWAWTWRRTLLLAVIGVPLGVTMGFIHGTFAHHLHEGMLVAIVFIVANLVILGIGPCFASAVRHRALPVSLERTLVVASIVLGVVVGLLALEAAEQFHDHLMGDTSQRLTDFRQIFTAAIPTHEALSRMSDLVMTLAFHSACGGVLAIRAYLGEADRWHRYEERKEIDALRQARLDAERRLTLLQAQVEPHFLFNTLASVRSLVQEDPRRAVDLIEALSIYLRATMPRLRGEGGEDASTLAEQFDLCRAYLGIMNLRLGGRLAVDIDLPAGLATLRFPSLILVTLVENAVTHGVEPHPGASRIQLRARQSEVTGQACLLIEVLDDGAGLKESVVQGTGLANVREQLAGLFGPDARLSVESRASGGVRAAMSIPMAALQS